MFRQCAGDSVRFYSRFSKPEVISTNAAAWVLFQVIAFGRILCKLNCVHNRTEWVRINHRYEEEPENQLLRIGFGGLFGGLAGDDAGGTRAGGSCVGGGKPAGE